MYCKLLIVKSLENSFETSTSAYPVSAKRWAAILLFGALWLAFIRARGWIIHPACAENASACDTQSLFRMDQYSLGLNSSWGEELSLATQYLCGILIFAIPLLLHFGRRALEDILIVTQAVLLNGTLTELARLIVQRPRPFVYADPKAYGADIQNYTSFYSGHTSFAAASTIALTLVLWHRGAPRWARLTMLVSAMLIIFATAIGRVTAGRHFPTDTLGGMIAGGMVAFLTVGLTQRPNDAPYFEQT